MTTARNETTVADIMQPDPVTVKLSTTVADPADLLGVGRRVGLVSAMDVERVEAEDTGDA